MTRDKARSIAESMDLDDFQSLQSLILGDGGEVRGPEDDGDPKPQGAALAGAES